ncbi:xanthine dehydrogenase accessory protein XdhC [Pseudooceanicola nitratireducens]|uniref:xanthine dehydrogenase accessory protein XdhC n=1 Tax=Pseudooceanicola nitratireducens TaxID=517719 RepID=UPI0023F3BB1D|nr:xanthine dehydrogenase accessory protein XdhC [Pseudooceanicola nitratireducens]
MVDLDALSDALETHGPLVRVVVAEARGSVPREAGAAMLIGPAGRIAGTIGGGALEFEAIEKARGLTGPRVETRALGPDLGQCCGGAVTLAYDRIETLPESTDGVILRRLVGAPLPPTLPLPVQRAMAQIRNGGQPPAIQLIDGWLIEPVARRHTALWVWGAGHVGRTIVTMAAPLPEVEVTWIDVAADRFPQEIPRGVTMVPAARPEQLIRHAPREAHHLVLTYSHTLDLALCDALLRHGFASAGLIGSASKWARFRRRLGAMGHADARIHGISCPIGTPRFGKHPQQIAVGVMHSLLGTLSGMTAQQDAERDMTG